MGLSELDALSKSYGLAIALLLFAVFGLLVAVRHLYRENNFLHGRLEDLAEQRAKYAIQSLVIREEGKRGRPED